MFNHDRGGGVLGFGSEAAIPLSRANSCRLRSVDGTCHLYAFYDML